MRALRHFRLDAAILLIALAVAFWYGGFATAWLAFILVVVEIVFSFDNAAVNAKYLLKMNAFWQRMFMTVGILIAVVGMRLAFPFLVVCLSGGVGPITAVRLAAEKGNVDQPGTYAYILHSAHPSIAAFGGMFLLMLFLDFLFEERELTWLTWVERPLLRVGRLDQLSVVVAGLLLLIAATWFVDDAFTATVLVAGLVGIVSYVGVNGLAAVMEDQNHRKEESLGRFGAVFLSGRAALSLFLFLEVLDASFSFDGVIGAFAITPDPIVIAIGLGVGAVFVRSMTIYLVREGTLTELRYLEHGAHWAIGALAILLLVTLRVDLPDAVIGLAGVAFIAAAWWSSVRENRRDAVASASPPLADESQTSGIYSSH
jgi:uncharacterized protein